MPFDLRTSFDMNLHHMVQAIVTVLAVINPVVCGSIFLTLTPKLALAQRRWAAVKVALSILIILLTSALIGLKVLSIFNISLDVFRIVGGMIIAYMGFDMLSGRHTVGQAPPPDDDVDAHSSFAPAHHVRRWTGDDHRRGDAGGRVLLSSAPQTSSADSLS
jgi:small neutral amino acid transporter SnatA (MarC family)